MKDRVKHIEHGYSLTEVLVVVAILAILTALSIPLFNWRGQVAASNLENIRSYLEATRRAALKGQACRVSITTANLRDGVTVLSATPVGSAIESVPCGSPTSLQLESAYSNTRYLLTVNSDSGNVSAFTFTPRGTIFNSSTTPSFSGDLVFNLRVADSSLRPISSSYCLRLSGVLGSVQGIGSQSC